MTQEELKEILDKHLKWLNKEDDGERLDLSGADLSGANLRGTDLRGASLYYANLSDADLSRADLRGGGSLHRANLFGADLRYAKLGGTNLSSADLSAADLRSADLEGADLRGARLYEANLSGANLHGSNLLGASLRYTNLTHADYTDTVLNLQCPEEGGFIAWKKLIDNKVAKLFIPEDAKRSSATTRKCRASKAIVMAIYNKTGEKISEGRSKIDNKFIYQVGETVHSNRWDEDRWNECSNGIHFFMTRNEAEKY